MKAHYYFNVIFSYKEIGKESDRAWHVPIITDII